MVALNQNMKKHMSKHQDNSNNKVSKGDTRQKRDKISTRTRQGLAKTRTAREKSGAAVLPPKGGFQLNIKLNPTMAISPPQQQHVTLR